MMSIEKYFNGPPDQVHSALDALCVVYHNGGGVVGVGHDDVLLLRLVLALEEPSHLGWGLTLHLHVFKLEALASFAPNLVRVDLCKKLDVLRFKRLKKGLQKDVIFKRRNYSS